MVREAGCSCCGKRAVLEAADVTDTSTFSEDLWRGVTQVVSAVGPTFQRTEEGPK